MSNSLPGVFKPTKTQLETPHYYGIDLLPSPSLRDRLLTVPSDIARRFIQEIGILGQREDKGQLIIWGEDAKNEINWELSQSTLQEFGWVVGRVWVNRANYWRQKRGIAALPAW